MEQYNLKKYLYIFINTAILIINLSIINIGLKALMSIPRWCINIIAIINYLMYLYFFLKNNEEKKIQMTKFNISILVFSVILFLLSCISIFGILIKENGVKSVLESYGGFGRVIYFIICFLQPIILPLPEPITITAGNLVFGKLIGFILGFLGTVLGIVTMFTISRVGNKKLKLNIINSKNLEKYNKLVEKNETFILIILFIFPILPDEIICIGAGLGLIKFKKFLLIAIFSKLFTVGMYSISSGVVKDILELNLIYQLLIVLAITIVFFISKKIIQYIKIHQNTNS
ncbi:MAG: TVP38/TMEM64 family protein [Sarcina sp.]